MPTSNSPRKTPEGAEGIQQSANHTLRTFVMNSTSVHIYVSIEMFMSWRTGLWCVGVEAEPLESET